MKATYGASNWQKPRPRAEMLDVGRIPVEAAVLLRLLAEARRRRLSVRDLIAELVTTVARDDLFKAVLDE